MKNKVELEFYNFRFHRSIVRISTKTQSGAGFWVKGFDGRMYVLTCAHVIGTEPHPELAFCQKDNTFQGNISANIVRSIPEADGDLALLEVETECVPEDAQDLLLLDIDFTTPPVFMAWGFPPAYKSNGRLGFGSILTPTVNNQNLKTLQLKTDTDVRGGFSGGPLIHYNMGFVIGLVNEMERPNSDISESVSYALSVQEIKKHFFDLLPIQTRHPYQAWLASQYHDLVLNDERGVRLSDIYVEPNFGIHEYCAGDKAGNPQKTNGFYPVNESLHKAILDWVFEKPRRLQKKEMRMVLLLGYPGQGKTSFTKRFLHDLAQTLPDRACYQVRLKSISDLDELKNRPFKVIKQAILEQAQQEIDDIDLDIKLDHAILVLDGLDELKIKRDIQGRDIDDICQAIVEEAEQSYPNLKILLTSRYGYVNLERLKDRQIQILQLEEFDLAQQKLWLGKYRNFHDEGHLNDELLERYNIQNDPKFAAIRELITQPILLQMVASLKEDLSTNVNRAAIYDKMFTQLIERPWASDGQIKTLSGSDAQTLREALQDIAYQIFYSDKGYIYKSQIDKLERVAQLQQNLGNSIDLWRTVMVAFYLDEVKKGARRERDDDRDYDYAIEFLHKSLPEYLCAEKIWRDIRDVFASNSKLREDHALDYLGTIFQSKLISQEIVGYLTEIIKNDKSIDKVQFFNHFTKHWNYFFDRDFYPETAKDKPYDTMVSLFYGYLTVTAALDQNMSTILNTESLSSFNRLLKTLVYANSRIKVDLRNMNLGFINLKGASLMFANLMGANLMGANLISANLMGANLEKANLYGTNLEHADLFLANLEQANLYSAILDAANLIRANLEGANLERARIEDANLQEANLERVNLFHANLQKAYLKRVNLQNASLEGADLQNADLEGADLQNANLLRVNLLGVNLQKANLLGANNLTHSQFASVESLYNCQGLPSEIEEQLRQTHPHLFEKPDQNYSATDQD